MAKKTLFKLEFDSPFKVMGVFCQEKDYRFAWILNTHLQFGFRKEKDFTFYPSQQTIPFVFSVYSFDQTDMQRSFFLVSNRSLQGQRLFDKPPSLDYIFLVKADAFRFDFSELLKKIRGLKQVTAAYLLDDILGRKKEGFLYDFEVFLTHDLKVNL